MYYCMLYTLISQQNKKLTLRKREPGLRTYIKVQ